jgi:hypothetical protein
MELIFQSRLDSTYYIMKEGEHDLQGALEEVQEISRQRRGKTMTLEHQEVKIRVDSGSDIAQLVAAHEVAPRQQPMAEVGP